MKLTPTIVITVKNRLDHFIKTFPFNVSQLGIDYNVLYVDYDSEDDFVNKLNTEIEYRKDMFSPNLKKIKLVRLRQQAKYDIRKAKNLGAAYACKDSNIIILNDADTMLSMNYLQKWCKLIYPGKTFVTNRVQESKASYPKRINSTVNYGNIIVASKDLKRVCGYDEDIAGFIGWGGDDDDLFHRLKLSGLREINPYTLEETGQYSIMHSDELRFKDTLFPNVKKPDALGVKEIHDKVYCNINRIKSRKSDYLNHDFILNISTEEVIYENKSNS